MTSTSYLATSVEASRLRHLEEGNNFFYHADKAEQRALTVSQACADWAPTMSAHWLGSDKFIITILCPGRRFDEAYHIHKEKAFYHVEELTPAVLFVRCLPPSDRRHEPERFVLEEVAMCFMPF
ncbi:MAG: hypothetical protein K9J37_13640 [Saprospiraceae bacterium]|nr:hypothetical protein [Saprospiraceae bacterium]MCF8250952.1 hypothetical protein [Saprospiraceae bacterium]MCF8281929.1 hypothetical protein [Bacteroidales bacterium]MCF8311916.1 hypothetical protein [Saprospiraceae bacterium]MCF8441924.1 hypothetical protein [Saprospiraceae bacterium]